MLGCKLPTKTLRITKANHLTSLPFSLDWKVLSCTRVWVMPFVFYPDDVREKLAKTLGMEEVAIPPNSAFIGHGYL